MSAKNFKVIKAEALSSRWDERFVVIDSETGEVLDDAQGYGYKSRKKAYAAYGYKSRRPGGKAKAEKKKVKAWLGKNKAFVRNVEDFAFICFKEGEHFGYAEWKEELEKSGIDLEGLSPRDIWRYM